MSIGKGFIGMDTDGLRTVLEHLKEQPRSLGWYYDEDRLKEITDTLNNLHPTHTHIVSCVLNLPKDLEPFKEKGTVGWWAILVCKTKTQTEHGNEWQYLKIPLDHRHLDRFYSETYSFEPKRLRLSKSEEEEIETK